MDEFRIFEGKSIDDAISQALTYFDVARAQLEIDIISDAKAGIFGLVGARKAQIKARRRESPRKQMEAVREAVRAPLEDAAAAEQPRPQAPAAAVAVQADPAAPETAPISPATPAPEGPADTPDAGPAPAGNGGKNGQEKSRRSRSRQKPARKDGAAQGAEAPAAAPRPARSRQPVQASEDSGEAVARPASSAPAASALPDLGDEQAEAVKEQVQQMLEQLLAPLVGEPVLQLSMPEPGKILVGVDAGEDAGLLIGKEGGTLAALQYLANRILAKQCEGPLPRVSLEAGNYRERQDDTLRQLALGLAEKARTTGKAQSTRPLSSYHRRVIHLALQEDGGIVTRSKGEGALKRVIIMPKKVRRAAGPEDGAAVEAVAGAADAPQANGRPEAGSNGSAADGSESPAKPRRPRRPRRRRSQGDAQRQAASAEQGQSAGEQGDIGGDIRGDIGEAAAPAPTPEPPAAMTPAETSPATPPPPAEQ